MKKRQREKLTAASKGLSKALGFVHPSAQSDGLQSFIEGLFDFLTGFDLNVHVLVTGRDEVQVSVSIEDKQP